MKAILEFDLTEEREQFEDACNGSKWSHAMWTLNQYLRTKTKYASDGDSLEAINAYQDARDQLYLILSEENLEMR